MRYRLRTLLIVTVISPALIAAAIWAASKALAYYRESQRNLPGTVAVEQTTDFAH